MSDHVLCDTDYVVTKRRTKCADCRKPILKNMENVVIKAPGYAFPIRKRLCLKCMIKRLDSTELEIEVVRRVIEKMMNSKEYKKKVFVQVMSEGL